MLPCWIKSAVSFGCARQWCVHWDWLCEEIDFFQNVLFQLTERTYSTPQMQTCNRLTHQEWLNLPLVCRCEEIVVFENVPCQRIEWTSLHKCRRYFLNRFVVTSLDFGQAVHARYSRQCCEGNIFWKQDCNSRKRCLWKRGISTTRLKKQ